MLLRSESLVQVLSQQCRAMATRATFVIVVTFRCCGAVCLPVCLAGRRRCPVTTALLENIPTFMSDGIPFAFSFFSVMPGGTGATLLVPALLAGPC